MRSWNTRWAILLPAAFALACLTPVLSRAAEEKEDDDANEVTVTMDQLPAAVKTTLQREAGDGKIAEIEKETEGDKTTYEADVTIAGKPYEIEIADDGTLISKALDDEEGGADDDDKKKQQ